METHGEKDVRKTVIVEPLRQIFAGKAWSAGRNAVSLHRLIQGTT